MKYFSTFSGIGGFEIAIHSVFPNAGYKCLGNAVCVEVIKHILENEKTKN